MGGATARMGDKKLFENLVKMCIDSDGEDPTPITELRHLIQASDEKGVTTALDCIKGHIKGKAQAATAACRVLRGLMQNCSNEFQAQGATKDWMDRFCKVAAKADGSLKELIMECVVDWGDEFKFESWGDVFAQGVKDLEKTGLAAPEPKKKVHTPKQSNKTKSVPSTAEKASMRSGGAQQQAVTAGDDYWKAECESWRIKWEQEASTILTLEQTMQKMRATGGKEIDIGSVKQVTKQLKVLKFQ